MQRYRPDHLAWYWGDWEIFVSQPLGSLSKDRLQVKWHSSAVGRTALYPCPCSSTPQLPPATPSRAASHAYYMPSTGSLTACMIATSWFIKTL